ncbi:hypothetical protein ES319_A13G174600v1 [Gossypium barbadense]|uniref:Uncharacterized protein n=2 Tax=Gossypium TaxID=3633 RepID=A0A5J5T0P3_GOSBA|nr:hypothetical protein ES319_A13G174600v1 [Gossypium barbadense]KAB2049410.1 hypothetical protein ES319_A13G174600v1 [Gossypium barbadense]TYH92555.1 hypothetical protein ES332_A13G189600v1 [Gossypium tomentosum]TYH92557.1 hypothetical protein ES332_A13G189600v1 [Gossypium tomentosum]
MQHSSHKLSCEMLAYCFPLIIQLSNYKSRIIHNIGLLVGNLKYRRTYSSQNLLEPVSGRLITSSQFVNHPSQRRFSQSSCYQKFAPAETHSILRSSGLQHRFKNWQELRKHKLTASTFAGAVGFFLSRRTKLWLEKLGAIPHTRVISIVFHHPNSGVSILKFCVNLEGQRPLHNYTD